MIATKFKAVCNPFDSKDPDESDKLLDKSLEAYMEKEMKEASNEDQIKRREVLAEVKFIFLEWVKQVAIQEKRTEDEVEDAGGHIFISGSHRLGLRDVGADIDAVCIAPNFCTREHFFTSLKAKFLEKPEVTELIAVEGAQVPIISFDFKAVSIDLLFARLVGNSVPANLDILDDNILTGLDMASEKSLNGPRVTDMIVEIVTINKQTPEEKKKRIEDFKRVLRCIRRWAKQRGLYGNKLGYLGGVNCNLLVAFLCQLYPNASPSKLLNRFFFVFSEWEWPHPVMLNQPQPNPPNEHREIWAKENHPYHVMPIITPAYPAMNSAANVSAHSLEVMRQEFRKGYAIIKQIISEGGLHWEKLFAPSDFFISYNHYLCCHIIGTGQDDASRSWMGFVESRIRHLSSPKYLGNTHQYPIKLPIHFYPVVSKTQKSANSICYFFGFNVDNAQLNRGRNELHLDECFSRFTDYLLDPEKGYKGPKHDGLDFSVEHFSWKRLPPEVFAPIGGKEAAKQLRAKLGLGSEKRKVSADEMVETSAVPAPPPVEGAPSSSSAATSNSNEVGNEIKLEVTSTEVTPTPPVVSEIVVPPAMSQKRLYSEVSGHAASEELLYPSQAPMLYPIVRQWQEKRKLFSPHVSWTMLEK